MGWVVLYLLVMLTVSKEWFSLRPSMLLMLDNWIVHELMKYEFWQLNKESLLKANGIVNVIHHQKLWWGDMYPSILRSPQEMGLFDTNPEWLGSKASTRYRWETQKKKKKKKKEKRKRKKYLPNTKERWKFVSKVLMFVNAQRSGLDFVERGEVLLEPETCTNLLIPWYNYIQSGQETLAIL